MAMNDNDAGPKLDLLNENLARVEGLSKRLIDIMARKPKSNSALGGPDQEVFASAMKGYWSEMVQNPAKILEHQLDYWGKSVKHFVEAQQVLAKGKLEAPSDSTGTDRRFSNELWKTHPFFNYVKQQYLLNSEAIQQAVQDVEGLDPTERRRLNYFSQQIIDMMSPTNFLGTNPDALEKAVATEGESLIIGLENLINDLEANDGELVVRLADETAFELGENIATAPGKVVFRNHMFELIQYSPTTDTVHEIPVVVFPPWINKFYILDLKEQNSMIRWITAQGYTLFIVSWVNPDMSHTEIGLDDYIKDGYLAAFDEVKSITGQKQLNAVGYCIAGTTLSMTLSLMKQSGDTSVKSATFFTTLTDFSDQGEFTPFLQNDFIDGIEAEVEEKGLLRSYIMARTFSFLRSNDLVYTPAIKSYMMGETPPAFDLLYWNGDGANLPGRMTTQYLRCLCQQNQLAEGGIDLLGKTLRLKDVEVPVFSIACETDHIAAWKNCYSGVQQMGSKDKTFLVSESGHIAGIVNPPSRNKYGHYTNTDLSKTADDWFDTAEFTKGSWWPRWESWLKTHSGKQIPARQPGDSDHPILGDAPGTYVRVTSKL